jgi:hypothetical protein
MAPTIVGFTMRTTMLNSLAEVRALPFSSNLAAYYGPLPAGASREFICQIGIPIAAPGTQEKAPILLRGLEEELPAVPPPPAQPEPSK